MGIGKYVHYAVDLVLISMILAGIKKSSGLTLSVDQLVHSTDSKSFLHKYLSFGESCFDALTKFCKRSQLFKPRSIENYDDLKDAVKRGVNDLIDETGNPRRH